MVHLFKLNDTSVIVGNYSTITKVLKVHGLFQKNHSLKSFKKQII